MTTTERIIGGITGGSSSSGMTDPMTTRGDMIIRNAANATARLAVGGANEVLTSDGTDIAWAAPSIEGTAVLSTGEAGGTKFLREDGDGTCSWQTVSAAPGGADTQFQYNNGGAFGGISSWAYNDAADTVAITGTGTTTTDFSLTSAVTTGLAMQIIGNSLTADAGRASLLDIYSNSADTGARTLVKITNDNATSGANVTPFSIDQDSSGRAILITHDGSNPINGVLDIDIGNLGTGTGLDIAGTNLSTGKIIDINSNSNVTTATLFLSEYISDRSDFSNRTGVANSFISSRTDSRTSGTTSDDYDLASFIRTNVTDGAGGTNNSAGSTVYIGTVSTETAGTLNASQLGLEINHQIHNDAAEVYAVGITCDNSGTAAPAGIDMSSFTAGEHVFKFVADATDPTSGGGAATGRIAVNVGGSTVYLPYY